jgi:hypothetical protein
MHYRFLVTFNKKDADNSERARKLVYDTLHNEGFVYPDGRWSGGMADWLVIGGRWSGELSRHSLARSITTQIYDIEQEHDLQVWGTHYGDPEKQKQQRHFAKLFQQMWDKAAPKEYRGIPYQRDTYKVDGYADDAMILTRDIYDGLLKEYEGSEDSEYHADLDYEPVSPDMIGKKWIVVVDYHN